MRLQCVVTLTLVTLSTLSKSTKVMARAFGAAEPQSHGLDTLPVNNARRQWPVRLLSPFSSSSFAKTLAHSPVGKLFTRQMSLDKQEHFVTKLFNIHNVKEANAQNFFESTPYVMWKQELKARVGRHYETLILSTLYKELDANDNGGVEAIVSQALTDPNTHALGVRYENLLLQKWVDGVKSENYEDVRDFVRYALYRGPARDAVYAKMQKLLGEADLHERILNFEKGLALHPRTPFHNLEKYFLIISRGMKITDVLENLVPVRGFNNNAFMLKLLYDKTTDPKINVNFAGYILIAMRLADWSDAKISTALSKLENEKISADLDPLVKAMA